MQALLTTGMPFCTNATAVSGLRSGRVPRKHGQRSRFQGDEDELLLTQFRSSAGQHPPRMAFKPASATPWARIASRCAPRATTETSSAGRGELGGQVAAAAGAGVVQIRSISSEITCFTGFLLADPESRCLPDARAGARRTMARTAPGWRAGVALLGSGA
jgi:hypothetical protein